MQYSRDVEEMVCVKKGAKHEPAPIPEEEIGRAHV